MEIRTKDVNNVNGDGDGGNGSPRWSFDTNWTVANGSLGTAVAVESSDSVIAVDDDGDDTGAVDSVRRSQPLILKPPSTDSGPCEIKICFTQKYEIRQVYIRSTARVYEIYYAPSLQASNEYLCTVRCCTAVRDGETLQVPIVENFTQQNTRVSTGELTEAKYSGEANISTSEDDWVEVKGPESPLHENVISSLPNKTAINGRSSIQDLFEATAEVSDADPCTSITVRLLSLQNKCCVYVDEVYVFADAVDPSDLENQPGQMGGLTGSSLMAMLVPTLMQFSRSSAKQVHEKDASNKMRNCAAVEAKSVGQTHVVEESHQDEKLSSDLGNVKLHDSRAEPARVQLPSPDPAMDRCDDPSVKNDLPPTRIEGLLEQLVSRVSRVEDFCSRFEENMLKPINSMEARLQRVEQQLEVLSKNSQYSGLPPCTRICAPSFSCGGSNSSSIYDDSSRHTPPGISDSEKRDLRSTDMSKLSNDLTISDSVSHFLPSLVITAPEFSCGEDDEDNNLKSSEGTSLEKPKRPFSIDDALAAALSGFLSTSSNPPMEDPGTPKVSVSGCTRRATENNGLSAETFGQNAREFTTGENNNKESSKFTGMLTVAAPELTMEGGGDEEHPDYLQSPSVTASQCMGEEDGNENRVGSQSNDVGNCELSSDVCVLSGRVTIPTDVSREGCAEQNMIAVSVVVDEQCQSLEAETKLSFEGDGDACLAGLARGFEESNSFHVNEVSGSREPSNVISSMENDVVEMLSGNQVEGKCDTPESIAESTERVAGEGSDRNTLLNLTESSSAPVLDLDFPILDVNFSSHESSFADYPLEALLCDVADYNIQTPGVEEVYELITGGQADYIVTGHDDGAADLPTDNVLLLDLGINAEDVSSNLGVGLHHASTSSNHSILASLI